MNPHFLYAKLIAKIVKKRFELTPSDSVEAVMARIERSTIQKYWTQNVTKQTQFIGVISRDEFVLRKRLTSNSDFGYTIYGEYSRSNISFTVVPGTIPSAIMPIAILLVVFAAEYFGVSGLYRIGVAIMCFSGLSYCVSGIFDFLKAPGRDFMKLINEIELNGEILHDGSKR